MTSRHIKMSMSFIVKSSLKHSLTPILLVVNKFEKSKVSFITSYRRKGNKFMARLPSFHTLPTSCKWWILQAGAKSPRECFICKLYPPSRLSIIYWNLLTASNFVLQKAFFIDIAKWMVCVCKCGLGEFVLQKLLFIAINLSLFFVCVWWETFQYWQW